MTPSPSEPTDGPAPEKPRKPTIRNAKDSAEFDLWDFDEEPASAPVPPAPVKRPEPSVPEPKPRARPIAQVPRAVPVEEKRNPLEPVPRRTSPAKQPPQPFDPKKRGDDIGELDSDWDMADLTGLPEGGEKPKTPAPVDKKIADPEIKPPPARRIAKDEESEPEPKPEPATDAGHSADQSEVGEEPVSSAEKAPNLAEISSFKERLGLTRTEKIGLSALAAVLLVSSLVLFFFTRDRLAIPAEKPDHPTYPVKGGLVTVLQADSFWRKPISGTDVFRRGTKLIPVLKLRVEGGPCALRVAFRDADGTIIGDSITRSVTTGTLEFAGTSGLEDIGMHAAIRTGTTKPWTVEVKEAPSADSSSQDFKKLFESTVSTELQP